MSQALELFWSFDGNNSEVEDLSDIDDPVGDPEYQPSRQEQSSSEEDSSGCEDPIIQPSKPDRGREKREKYEGYRSDGNFARSCEGDDSNNVPEETTSGPSHQDQSQKVCGM